jgi:hypothetical protein
MAQAHAADPISERSIEPVVRWEEDRTEFRPSLLIDAATYRPEPLFPLPPQLVSTRQLVSPAGRFSYANRILPAGTPLWTADPRGRHGVVRFTGDVVIPTLYDFAARPTLNVWMSLTPMEVFTLRPGLRLARGKVVVAGLGLGWFLRKVHDLDAVEEVVLIEANRDLLDWYGEAICRRLPKVTQVICGDAYAYLGRLGKHAKYLYDIWPRLGEAARDRRFQAKKLKLPHAWGWGDREALRHPAAR